MLRMEDGHDLRLQLKGRKGGQSGHEKSRFRKKA